MDLVCDGQVCLFHIVHVFSFQKYENSQYAVPGIVVRKRKLENNIFFVFLTHIIFCSGVSGVFVFCFVAAGTARLAC